MIENLYSERRKLLAADKKNEAFIFISGHEKHLQNFRLNRNFYYLTGFVEPDSIFVFRPNMENQSVMFVRPKDASKEVWDGKRLGVEGTKSGYDFDQVISNLNIKQELPKLLSGIKKVHFQFGQNHEDDAMVLEAIQSAHTMNMKSQVGMADICDPSWSMAGARFIKSEHELNLMRENCKIAADSHKFVMSATRPGMSEKQIQGLLINKFFENGCTEEAYASIVAGGDNATVLHYRENKDLLRDGELLLIDAGSQKHFYAADITRTFPIGKTFTPAQKQIYAAVLETQLNVIKNIKLGMNFSDLQTQTIREISSKLKDLGFLKGSVDEIIESKTYQPFYPHGVSHYLGLDVHDLGHYKNLDESQKLKAGMVFTIEPGIYISSSNESVPKEFRGIGVRIEDDIALTGTGCEVMTAAAPKLINEVEELRYQAIHRA